MTFDDLQYSAQVIWTTIMVLLHPFWSLKLQFPLICTKKVIKNPFVFYRSRKFIFVWNIYLKAIEWTLLYCNGPFSLLGEEYICLVLQVRLLLSHTNQNKQAFNQLSNWICSVYRSCCISVKSAERERLTKIMYFLCNLVGSVLELWWW